MLKRLLALGVLTTFVVLPALAASAHKDGTTTPNQTPTVPQTESQMRADWVYNTGGAENFVPTTGGSATGWGEYFITTVQNNTGQDLTLVELGFPCSGPPTDFLGWLVWLNLPGMVAPVGDASTADYFGEFTPVDPDPATFPPTVYTYVDISAANIVVPAGTYFCFGYDVTGNGGQTSYNGVETWAWYTGIWDSDVPWGRTAILQVKGVYGAVPTEMSSWGQIKGLYR